MKSYGQDTRFDFTYDCVHCYIGLDDMTLGQGNDTPFGHGQ